MMEKFLLFVALPVVLVCALIEAWVLSRRARFDWKAMGVSMADLIGRTVVSILLPLSIVGPAIDVIWRHRLATAHLDSWQGVLILFFGQEFCYYCYHRAAHRVRWFWCHHSVHHSPNELNLSAAFRVGLLGKLIGNTLFFIPLIWIGFSPRIVAATLALNLLYQFWIHATWIPRLGWLEYVFNTPSAHRVHHAANLEYLDANYGGVLIVFDRLFGTYSKERDDIACRYGLVHPQTSYNPLRIEFDPWAALARDLLGARSIRAVLGYLLMPPGWKPDGEGETTEELRLRAAGSRR
ncbi:sterol desaturase family protein [Massilia antarctica]|uniref:sterol desaturase family protein n=1 Tax=Massilia antarctica TaxID=2765360 RepID=UPI0006BB7CE0|nr:sterol desaturase family protein [Massilia sp. H27-R4]MCY0913394.1 sterol desaturase family protein [Massilia sp. H27-R4]CUI09525.1 Sterol desaturase [Janthinobacterium sp. CG23_2]CUU33311.1 Sterol desaturase [Janthinobacterium sp. CG23_2]